MPKLLRLEDGAMIDVAPDADLMIDVDRDLLEDDLDLSNAGIVCLAFPKFKDGRAFTQARLIRQRFGFAGELRACGHVLPDQALYLRRVGVDAVQIEDEARAEDFRFALGAYRHVYQRAVEGSPAFEEREAKS